MFAIEILAERVEALAEEGGELVDPCHDVSDPAPVVAATDTIEMRCIYDNSTDTAVAFGLSTTDEMCFGAFYYTPAVQDEIDCIE